MRRLSGSPAKEPAHLCVFVSTLEGRLENAQFSFAGCGDFLLILALGVDDDFLLLGSFGVFNCYFQVFSEHFGRVLL